MGGLPNDYSVSIFIPTSNYVYMNGVPLSESMISDMLYFANILCKKFIITEHVVYVHL